MANVFRKDEIKASPSADEMLKNAPEQEEQCFKVPKIIQ
jgi:aspartyl/glutamyl-tRNA(Asn/Gln) amidotransferase C subunit